MFKFIKSININFNHHSFSSCTGYVIQLHFWVFDNLLIKVFIQKFGWKRFLAFALLSNISDHPMLGISFRRVSGYNYLWLVSTIFVWNLSLIVEERLSILAWTLVKENIAKFLLCIESRYYFRKSIAIISFLDKLINSLALVLTLNIFWRGWHPEHCEGCCLFYLRREIIFLLT